MKKQNLLSAVFISSVATMLFAGSVTTPERMNYQGRLLQGTNLANGSYQMTFGLYTNQVLGSPVYRETQNVDVVDGLYSVGIGASNINLGAALMNAPVWLECTVDGVVLSPREKLSSVPYAIIAGSLADTLATKAGKAGRNWDFGLPGHASTSSAYRSVLQFIYYGTNSGDRITTCRTIVEGSDTQSAIEIRILNMGGGYVVNSPIYIPQGTPHVFEFGGASNMPATQHVFEVQFRRAAGSGTVYFRSLTIE